MNQQLLQLVQEAPLSDLAPVFEILAERVYQHRKENNGYVPLQIFPFCVGIGGVYPCVEVIVYLDEPSRGARIFFKKREGTSEQGWEGQYQIPGVAGRITDSPADIFGRLAKELFGHDADAESLKNLNFVGIEIHDETERRATCWTLVYDLTVDYMSKRPVGGEWKLINMLSEDGTIIDHHRKTLEWYLTLQNRPLFVDLRVQKGGEL